MNATSQNRRQFVGHLSLGAVLSASAFAATPEPTSPPRRSKAAFEKCAARLETLGSEFLGVAPAEGRFLHLLVRLHRPRRVLEIGTCFGLGSIWMAQALEETDGRLVTVEIQADRVKQARKHLVDFGLDRRVTVHEGNAHELVLQLEGAFDLVLLNADKSGALDYFNKLHPQRLATGAVLVAPGAIREPEKLRPYLEALRAHEHYESVLLSVIPEDGFLLSCRTG